MLGIFAMKSRSASIFACASVGFLIPITASAAQQLNGWSKAEYASMSAVRSQADQLSDSMINSCLGMRNKPEGIKADVLPNKNFRNLKLEIDNRFELDQDARLMYQMTGYDPNSYAAIVARNVDAYNLLFVKGVYHTYGFLGTKDVGLRSARDFLLLVIHADKDRRLQTAVLNSINKLPASDPDKSRFSGETIILKNRASYNSKGDGKLTIPYEKPLELSQAQGSQCIKNVISHWYPWYVQNSLDKKLLEKARMHTRSTDTP